MAPREHQRCRVAFLIHRGVNPGGRDAPGSLQPTQSSQHNRSERRKSGRGRHDPAPKGEGRRATDRSQCGGPQTRRLEGKGLDLRGHQLCGARNSQGTNPRTVAGERVSSPAEAMMQASVVTGLVACRDELCFPGRSRV